MELSIQLFKTTTPKLINLKIPNILVKKTKIRKMIIVLLSLYTSI